MSFTVQNYVDHVFALARAFNVRVVMKLDLSPDAAGAGIINNNIDRKFILIAPIIDETTYAVALHELGHCVHPTGMLYTEMSNRMKTTNKYDTLRDVRLQLEEERAAWEWAEHYALEWTVAMEQVKKISVEAYAKTTEYFLGRSTLPHRRKP